MDIEIKFYMAILFAAWYMSVGLAIYIIFKIRSFGHGYQKRPFRLLRTIKSIVSYLLFWPRVPWWIY